MSSPDLGRGASSCSVSSGSEGHVRQRRVDHPLQRSPALHQHDGLHARHAEVCIGHQCDDFLKPRGRARLLHTPERDVGLERTLLARDAQLLGQAVLNGAGQDERGRVDWGAVPEGFIVPASWTAETCDDLRRGRGVA